MQLTATQLRKRSDYAWQQKDQWKSLLDEAYSYCLPQRNLYDGSWDSGSIGKQKGDQVFDSTAVHATQRFANRIQAGIFPPDKRWMVLQPGIDITPEQEPVVRNACQEYTDKFFALLRQTNFDLGMGEMLMDLAIGTGAMMVQAGDGLNRINFTPVPSYLLAFEEGPDGTVQNVYRKVKTAVENITSTWRDAELSPALERLLEDEPQKQLTLDEATIYDREDNVWRYYVCHKSDDENTMLVSREMKRSVWVVSRFLKVPGEVMGRGVALSCLADIKTLNKTLELLLKNASINIAGVYTAIDDGVLNPQTIRIRPGAIIPVARNGGPQGPSLQPIPRSGDVQLAQIIINDLRQNIKQIMLDDSLPPSNASARSATEIVERMRQLATNISASFGRIITEAMVPLCRMVLQIMEEQGIIELPLKVDGLEIQIVPVSPIAQAQNLDEVQNVLQWLSITQQLGPTGIMTANMTEIADWVGAQLGVPEMLKTTPEEREQAMQISQEMMMAQAEAGPVDPGAPPPGAPM